MEYDNVTNRYLYPDRYIEMIPYFLSVYQVQQYACAIYTEWGALKCVVCPGNATADSGPVYRPDSI
jgi:hypothetical protein